MPTRVFYPVETYRTLLSNFGLLPFRFLRLSESKELLVNEVGEYAITPHGTVEDLIKRRLPRDSELYTTLKAKHFLTDSDSTALLDILASKYRTKYNFLSGFTKLHILVVTLRCDHSCHYCQVSRQTTDKSAFDMDPITAHKSIDLMMETPAPHVTLELQGGEPLLAFDLITQIVSYAKKRAIARSKQMDIVVTTNLANVTDEMLAYFRDEGIQISTSLDGPEHIHNTNRPRPGNNSYALTIRNINRAREILGARNVAALMTTTQLSLQHPIEIIDEYVRQGFHSIFLRPISPYGFALKSRKKTGYLMKEFLHFYKTGLDHILKINRGGYNLSEAYAKIILTNGFCGLAVARRRRN
jgi:His-Xaa-Ser system radical SAM maturase HxsB